MEILGKAQFPYSFGDSYLGSEKQTLEERIAQKRDMKNYFFSFLLFIQFVEVFLLIHF